MLDISVFSGRMPNLQSSVLSGTGRRCPGEDDRVLFSDKIFSRHIAIL